MAEHTVDRVLERAGTSEKFGPCLTKTTPLIGSENFEGNLNIKLIQAYGLNADVADHLVNTYGMRAVDVCELAKPTGKRWPRFGNVLVEGFPFIEAEVRVRVRVRVRNPHPNEP